jgi:hypothetical protein
VSNRRINSGNLENRIGELENTGKREWILQVERNFFPRWGFVSLCEILLLCNAN